MTLLFILAIRELGSSLFLYTSNTMVMAVLLLDYYEGGNVGITAAFSLVQTILLAVLIGIAHLLSRGGTDSRHRTRRIDTSTKRKQGGNAMTEYCITRRQFTAGAAATCRGVVRPHATPQAQNFGGTS